MKFSVLLLFGVLPLAAAATEFFVSPSGDNNNSGTSAEQPYRTLKRAADVLKPGDTMTLLPGVYHQSLEMNYPGGDAATTIRAAIPGTAILRGDVEAPAFEPVANSPRVWSAPYPEIPQAVNERDTLQIFRRQPNVAELEFTPGAWYYDEASKRLYVTTSDFAPPAEHRLTISDLRAHGILITAPETVRNVVIDGITVTGFNANSPGGLPGHNAKWGIYLGRPVGCAVRNATVFLNGSGIGFSSRSQNSSIENCRSYANASPFFGSGGNIIILTPSEKCAIRNCLSFDSENAGIRFYGGDPAQYCVFEHNRSFDNGYGDMWLKYPSDTTAARYCVAGDALYSRLIENCLFNFGDAGYFGAAKQSIIRPQEKNFVPDNEFADPGNGDYRPLADSQYRDRAPAPIDNRLFFVKPDGNDAADGRSLTRAWKTPKPESDSTLYILPDAVKHGLVLRDLKNVTVRGRGAFPVELGGPIKLENCRDITLERLAGTALEIRSSIGVNVAQCGFSRGGDITGSTVQLNNNALRGKPLSLYDGRAVIYNNIFDVGSGLLHGKGELVADFNSYAGTLPAGEPNSFAAHPEFAADYTLRNARIFEGRGSDAMPVGPYRRQARAIPMRLDGPKLLSGSATTANIEWWSNLPGRGILFYGENQDCGKRVEFKNPDSFQNLSLTGLTPGKEYFFRVEASGSVRDHFSNTPVDAAPKGNLRRVASPVRSFTTPAADRPGRVWFVAPDGHDDQPGTVDKPLRTISAASANAVAGDIVEVAAGTYRETVRCRATGDVQRPLIFRAAPGARVRLDGDRQLRFAFRIINKAQLTLDGFHIREILEKGDAAGVFLDNADSIRLTRCFYDGRSEGYTPVFVRAAQCRGLMLDNCVLTRGFHGLEFRNCPGLEMRNSVLYINQVNSCNLWNEPGEKATFRNNIWVDNVPQKVGNPLLSMGDAAPLEERDNCYVLRVPETEKPLFGYARFNGKPAAKTNGGEVLERQWKRQGRFGTAMVTYAAYVKDSGKPATALFIDPALPVMPEFVKFRDLAEWEANYAKRNGEHNAKELHYGKDGYRELDVRDFLSSNPELKKRNIGLEHTQFAGDRNP